MNRFISSLIVILYVILLPLISVIYVLVPTTKIGVIYRQPFVKFIGHCVPYLTFIVMIIVVSLVQEDVIVKQLFNETYIIPYQNYTAALNAFGNAITFGPQHEKISNMVLRSPDPLWLEYFIAVFIVGFAWQEVRQFFSEGIHEYFESFYNYLDMVMLVLYVTSYAVRFYALVKIKHSLNLIQDDNFWLKNDSVLIRDTTYWINNDRYYWDQFDPINLAEGLFAVANVLSFTRISYLLPANQQLGPLQISLGRMLGDISKFCVIFLMIFFAFLIGLNNLFWYYDDNVRNKTSIEDHGKTNAENNFGTIDATFQSVFWQLFGIGNRDGVLLEPYLNHFTEAIGYLLFGAYSIVAIVVLLNMLIAMMSKSLEEIQIDADVEWKFARSRLYMEYIKDGSSVPVPFNLLPTWKSLVHGIRRACNRNTENSLSSCCKTSDTETPHHNQNDRAIALEQGAVQNHANGTGPHGSITGNPGDKLTYKMVMSRIVKRFILQQQRDQQDEVSAADFDELKQDISAFRFDVRHDIRESTEMITNLAHTLCDVRSRLRNLEKSIHTVQCVMDQDAQDNAGMNSQIQASCIDDNAADEESGPATACDLEQVASPFGKFSRLFKKAASVATELGCVEEVMDSEAVDSETL